MSNKHKHYEMIVAKAANMSLVKFIKMDGEWENAGLSDKFISFSEEYDYFLCLPQHNENGQCLHWLNGGSLQWSDDYDEWLNKLDYADDPLSRKYFSGNAFLLVDNKFRIKTKKEKRWIATFPWSGNAFYVTPESFSSEELLNDYVDMHYGKRGLMLTHEIEVEV